MTDTFLNCQQNIFLEKCSEKKPSVGYSLLRNSPSPVWYVSQKFSEKKTSFGCCFSETNILYFVYFLCLAQSEEDRWAVPVGSS